MNSRLTGQSPRQPRLRRLLGMAAMAALLTAIALGILLLVTASSARSLVEKVQQTHDRVQGYSVLVSTLRSFQTSSYNAAHFGTTEAGEELAAARARYLAALDAVLRQPPATSRQVQIRAQINRQGHAVIGHLAQIREVVEDVERVWRAEGGKAAGAEATRSAAPVRKLEALLNNEILAGDKEIGTATNEALSINRTVLIACVVCLLLAVASWALIHGLLLRRLRPGLQQLEQGTLAFASGDLGHRVRLGGSDELARLASAFDTMAEQLAEKQLALQQIQAGLEDSVRERTQELERVNRELAASDGRRRAFLADIGHELRTPLTIIRGEAQVALRTVDEPGFNPQEAFERIIEHTRDLSRMVDDLFLIARAEAGGLPMQIQWIDLTELAARVAGDFEALATDMGASIRAVPGPAVFCDADPDRLRRALAALIDNALRHTRSGVQVQIEARATARGAVISVADDGPGVAPAIAQDLFERFRRGHTQGEGSGLGLSLVRALVEAQSGKARLESRPGGGVVAVLEFRAARALEELKGVA
jgi:signal transduction histidine kinase